MRYIILMCRQCNNNYSGAIYRSTLCPVCGAELKTCFNCKFYDKTSHWECRETIQEPVREKNRSNFCDYFSYLPLPEGKGSTKSVNPKGGETNVSQAAKNQFNSLFGAESGDD